jgi:hypothetical protein
MDGYDLSGLDMSTPSARRPSWQPAQTSLLAAISIGSQPGARAPAAAFISAWNGPATAVSPSFRAPSHELRKVCSLVATIGRFARFGPALAALQSSSALASRPVTVEVDQVHEASSLARADNGQD